VQSLVHVRRSKRTQECTATPTLPATLGRHTLSSGPAPHQVDAQIIAAGRISDGGAAVGLHADTVGSVGKDLPFESEIP